MIILIKAWRSCSDVMTRRENGNIKKADEMKSMCQEFDWVPVSMKDDWKTSFKATGKTAKKFLSVNSNDKVAVKKGMPAETYKVKVTVGGKRSGMTLKIRQKNGADVNYATLYLYGEACIV